jgi:hypothetical protein
MLQLTVAPAMLTANGGGKLKLIYPFAIHPFASVTITVYVMFDGGVNNAIMFVWFPGVHEYP